MEIIRGISEHEEVERATAGTSAAPRKSDKAASKLARGAAVGPPQDHGEIVPLLLTADEAAVLLRTTRKAVYAMLERGQLAGVRRLGRRVLIHREELLDSLCEKRASSPGR